MDKIWGPIPLHMAIVEALEKKGSLTEADLVKELKGSYGEVSSRELNKQLMKLEIWGRVRVTKLMKGKRMIELAQPVMARAERNSHRH